MDVGLVDVVHVVVLADVVDAVVGDAVVVDDDAVAVVVVVVDEFVVDVAVLVAVVEVDGIAGEELGMQRNDVKDWMRTKAGEGDEVAVEEMEDYGVALELVWMGQKAWRRDGRNPCWEHRHQQVAEHLTWRNLSEDSGIFLREGAERKVESARYKNRC